MMQDLVLPTNIFFTPTKEGFGALLPLLKGKRVVEIGAGSGLFAKLLRDAGVKVVPVDLFSRDAALIDVLQFDARYLSYKGYDIVVVARPCHGCWLDAALTRSLDAGCVAFYIGLPKNVDMDLGDLIDEGYEVTQPLNLPVGEEGERLYVIHPQ